MNKEVLLELLAKRHLTFGELAPPPGSALAELRTQMLRDRPDGPLAIDQGEGPLAARRLDQLPETALLIERARLYEVAGLVVDGTERWVEPAASRVAGPAGLDGPALQRAVGAGALTTDEARAVGFATGVYELVERDLPIARAAMQVRAATPSGLAASTVDLARAPVAEWERALTAAGVGPRDGVTVAELASRLAARFAALHPGSALGARLPSLGDEDLARHLAAIQPLRARNPKAVGTEPEHLDTAGLTPQVIEGARAAHGLLRHAALLYPGLRLFEVLDDPALSTAAKAQTAARRIGYIDELRREVGEEELLVLDYAPRSPDLARLALAERDIPPDEQRLVLATLKSYQRAYVLGGSPADAERLLLGGFASARAAALTGLEILRARTGLPLERARRIHERAQDLAGNAAVTVGALLDTVRDPLAESPAGNVAPSALDYLRELDGFEQLFEPLSFCACEACQSILGPAAYFVDLMKFVDDHIRPQLAAHPGHPLDLRSRRPDLWTLPLTCANTNDRIPVLQLVTEILEAYIADALAFTGSPAERRDHVYELLAGSDRSFLQPFHLPLARASAYLAHLGSSRAELAVALGAGAAVWTAAVLGLSPNERELITAADLDLDHHRTRYGVDFELAGATIEPVDVQRELLPRLPLDRAALDAVIATAFVRGGGAAPAIVARKRTPDSLQNDVEVLAGLTVDALDRIHRFTRLHRHLPWSIAELDRALTAVGATQLDAAALAEVAKLRELQSRWSLGVDEAAAIAGAIPRTPSGASWFDRVFNATVAGGTLPDEAQRFVHPSFRTTPAAPADPIAGRLAAALRLSPAELEDLVRRLAPHLGFDPTDPIEARRGFVLSAAHLGLLYRHVRLSRALGVSLDELFALAVLAGVPGRVRSADDALAIAELDAWRRRSGYRTDDLLVATGRAPREPSRYPTPVAVAAQLLDGGGPALTFEPTLFAVALGVTEAASAALIAANPALLAPAGARWRIADGADPRTAAIAIPASAVITDPDGTVRALAPDEVRAVLAPYRAADVVARRLAAALALAPEKVHALARLAAVDLGAPALVQALLDGGPTAPAVSVAAALRPLAVAFGSARWTADAIDHVRLHPSAYAWSAAPTVGTLRALAAVAELLSPTSNAELWSALDAYVPPPATGAGFPAAADGALAHLLGTDSGLVTSLRDQLAPAPVAAHTLALLGRAARLAAAIGVDGGALAALLYTDAAVLTRGADALLAAIHARHADEPARAELVAAIEQPLLEARRDALVDYVVRTLRPDAFAGADDLSPYFLIDVRAGGCQTSSRVIAAIGSVQLYVHRTILALEQDRRPAEDPAHVELHLAPDAADEWSWRQTYRTWEANRKVFLWPENYLEPDLRDDKTPLFTELEQELLQTDVTEQNVLDAYAKYLAGFEELANLTIAGAYHDIGTGDGPARDTLHLFGVSSSDPPIYYHRTCEQLLASGRDPAEAAQWSPWRKLDVQITGRRVAPVVYQGRLHVFWADYKTRSRSRIVGGDTRFDGYQHTMRVRASTLRLDGRWTAPQDLLMPVSEWFDAGRGAILDTVRANGRPDLDDRVHVEPIDDYTLEGPNWDSCWPEPRRVNGRDALCMRYRDFVQSNEVDLFARELRPVFEPAPVTRPTVLCARGPALDYGSPTLWFWSHSAVANLVVDERRLDIVERESLAKAWFSQGLYAGPVATLRPGAELLSIPGNVEDTIVQVGSDVIVLHGSITDDNRYVARRIGTTLAGRVARTLFTDGVDGLLDTATQRALTEAGLPLTPAGAQVIDRTERARLDVRGAYGTYFREIFFHIPALIANHLNAQGRFAAAQRWYRFLFDPTATEIIEVPPGTPPEERARRLRDRVWRYIELRGLDATSLRDVLTDPAALARYRRDPFNPHAIARLRLSAYQKAIVMKYVDNLLDWGDHLFAQFTMESVNEAVMLYLTAADLLGPRPAELGACSPAGAEPRDYEHIGPQLAQPDDLLIELETWALGSAPNHAPPGSEALPARFGVDRRALEHARTRFPLFGSTAPAPDTAAVLRPDWSAARIDTWSPPLGGGTRPDLPGHPLVQRTGRGVAVRRPAALKLPSSLIAQLTPVFCVPPNRTLLACWDRVEDRLYKIRHCMDLSGQRRELALLAPELDPALLVRARAAGVALDDVVATGAGHLPPYRFLYLIDRAKGFAASLQSFGAALLGALEKRDAEEMGRLRTLHQQHLAAFSTRLRDWDLQLAEESLAATEQQRDAAAARRDFYQALLDDDRNGWEIAESAGRHQAALLRGTEGALRFKAAAATLAPQVGSVFAMKYGGAEIGGSIHRGAAAVGALAQLAEASAASAQLEGNYARRREGWAHQRELAERDVGILDRQVRAAQLRIRTAQRSLELHTRALAQLDEVLELMDGKFSSLGLYTWLGQQLQRLYRGAYHNAMAVARLAEQAFRFERGDDDAPGLDPSYWDAARGGLLAGERLQLALQDLERRFLETNHRTHELDQAFSMAQIDPAALVELRETGTCELAIPEFYFDLFYPGHFKRRIRGVRLTIPCITGPYVNVSATLELVGSQLRPTPAPGAALVEVPPRRTTSIATSTAQNDAGVFELSFRDERYMPFEGAGAISRWRLRLPRAFRPFDYHTINDVILSISYTAEPDAALRTHVEQHNAVLEGTLLHYIGDTGLTRVLSLRQDFSSAFTRLLRSPAGTEVRLELSDRHFPVFAQGKSLVPTRAVLCVRSPAATLGTLALAVDGAPVAAWTPRPDLGGLLGAELPAAFTTEVRPRSHTLAVLDPGGLAPAAPDGGALDPDAVLDLVIVLAYRLT